MLQRRPPVSQRPFSRWLRSTLGLALGAGAFAGLSFAAVPTAGALIAPTSVVTTSAQNPNPYDTAVTLTATVTGSTTQPAGSVSFTAKVGGVTTTACATVPVQPSGDPHVSTAQCSYDPVVAGGTGQSAAIVSAYSGDTTYSGRHAASFTQVELGDNALTTFALASTKSPAPSGLAVTLSASLAGGNGTPTGSVTFDDNGTPIACSGSTTVTNSVAKCKYTPAGAGNHTITATYSGDTDYAAATAPVPFTQAVNGTVTPTSVVTTSSQNPNPWDTSVDLVATITGTTTQPGGTVKFSAKVGTITTVVCPAATVTATASPTVSQATCPYDPTPATASGVTSRITSVFSGDATYTAKTAVSYTQREQGSNTLNTFTLAATPSTTTPGHLVKLTAGLSGPSGTPTGTVVFFDEGQPVTCSGSTAPGAKLATGTATCHELMTVAGTHQITASYEGDVNYASASSPGSTEVVVTGTSVPGAPVIGTATDDFLQASVSFSPPGLDGNDPITGYTVTATDQTNPANGDQTAEGTDSPLTVTGLTGGDTYTFSVTATNGVGTGAASAPSNAIVAVVPIPPDPPTGLSATPYDGAAQVAFTPPANTNGYPVSYYTVTATDLTTPANGGETAQGPSSPVSIYGLTNGDSYSFTMTATTLAGTSVASGASNTIVPLARYGYVVPVGNYPTDVAADGTDAWVTNTYGNTVSEIDEATSQVIRTVGGFNGPEGIAVAGGDVWVTNVNGQDVTELSAATGAVLAQIPVGSYASCLAAAGGDVWVATLDGVVTEIDEATATVVNTNYGPFGTVVGIAADGSDVWTSNENAGVYEIDATDAQTVQQLTSSAHYGVGIASNGTTVWQANQFDNTVTEFSAATGQVLHTLTGFSEPWGVTVRGDNVWVSNAGGNSVVQLDASTAQITATYTTVGYGPGGLSADGTYTWVTLANDTVERLSAGPPPAPINQSAAVGGLTEGLVSFSPADDGTPAPTSYTVTATDLTTPANGGQTASGTSSPIVIGGLTTGDTYVFSVTGTNVFGTGPSSDDTNSVVPGPPYDQTITGVGSIFNDGTITSDGSHVWVATNSQSVVELTESGTVVQSIPEPGLLLNAIASDGSDVWVAAENFGVNPFSAELIELDATTGATVRTLSDFGSDDIEGVYSTGSLVFVTQPQLNQVTEVNAGTGAVVATVASGNGAWSIAGCGSTVWVANSGFNVPFGNPPAQGTLTEFNAGTGAEGPTVDVGQPYALSDDCTHVWVADNFTQGGGTNGVTELDAATGALQGTVTGINSPTAVASNGSYVWVSDGGANTVTELDEATGNTLYTVPAGNGPFALWADSDGVWVGSDNGSQLVELGINPGAPTIGSATAEGGGTVSVTFTPPAQGGSAAISSYTVTATDLTNPARGGQRGTGAASPVSVTGLTPGDTYTFTVTANNAYGPSTASAASNPVVA
jgi:YVTN family beta-propeller protein